MPFLNIFNLKYKISSPLTELEYAREELKIFRENMQNAMRFLNRDRSLSQIIFPPKAPLFLVIGADSAGKSSLLTHSELDLIDANYQMISNPMSTRYCHFWFSEKEIFVDTAGNYTASSTLSTNLAWRGLIKLINSYKRRCPLSGLIIAIDLPALSKDKIRLQQNLGNIKQRIYEIAKYAKELPVFIALTKSDLISGFNDFFANLSDDERQQPFGISFRDEKNLLPIQTFSEKFATLLQSLNNRLLPRLHQENHLIKRGRIKDFPLQIEKLKHVIAEIVNEIPSNAQTRLCGIYFTSSLQQGLSTDYLLNQYIPSAANSEMPASLNSNTYSGIKQQSYFIKNFFTKIAAGMKKKTNLIRFSKQTYHFLITCITVTLILAGLGGAVHHYYIHHQQTAKLQMVNASPPPTASQIGGNDLDATYSQLQKISVSLNQSHHSWLFFKNSRLKKLYAKTTKNYQELLETEFVPKLHNILETALSSSSQQNAFELYSTLKTYLMLHNPKNLNAHYVQKWFATYYAKNPNADKKIAEQQKIYLADSLKGQLKIDIDPKVVTNARMRLENIPPDQLAYIILDADSNVGNRSLSLVSDPESLLDTTQLHLPELYSNKSFTEISTNLKPILTDVISHSSVLNKAQIAHLLASEDSIAKLSQRVQTLYLANYLNLWNKGLDTVKVRNFSEFKKAAYEMRALAANNSPLFDLLEKIKNNTSLKSGNEQFNTDINKQFNAWHEIDTVKLHRILTDTADYFVDFSEKNNSEQLAWQAMARVMQNKRLPAPIETLFAFASMQPEPLKTWLKTLADNSLNLLFESSKAYINMAWATEVVPKFLNTLQNRYPLSAAAKETASLDDFSAFFRPKGIMDNFFNNYLEPFVDTSKSYWSWKKVANREIVISQTALEMFMRAFLIQKMFFPQGAKEPIVRFTLIPKALGPGVRSFMLLIDGQKVFAKEEAMESQRLIWPGPKSGMVDIAFTNQEERIFETTFTGPWAWFKLLTQSNFQANNDSQHYDLLFDLNGNSIRFELVASDVINPFIPDIINNFYCVAKL